MPYSAEISRAKPTCFLFLVDQSKSMSGGLGGADKSKAEAVADSINRLLYTLVLRCVWGQSILDRFHIGVVGYGRKVASGLGGFLAGKMLLPISEVARNPLRVEQRFTKVDDGKGGEIDQTIRFPIWFEPIADGKTPMATTLMLAGEIVTSFIVDNLECYPPIVINLTDGEASDGEPEPAAANLRQISSADGNVLLFNAHLSSRKKAAIEFPYEEAGLPDDMSRRLFRMSSVLPPPMLAAARETSLTVTPQTRGFVFNADMISMVRFLDIGTRVDFKNLRSP